MESPQSHIPITRKIFVTLMISKPKGRLSQKPCTHKNQYPNNGPHKSFGDSVSVVAGTTPLITTRKFMRKPFLFILEDQCQFLSVASDRNGQVAPKETAKGHTTVTPNSKAFEASEPFVVLFSSHALKDDGCSCCAAAALLRIGVH